MASHEHDPDDLGTYAPPRPRTVLASPPRTARVTPHTETLLRPLEHGEELCVRNESGGRVFVATDRSVRYLDGLIAERDRLKAELAGYRLFRQRVAGLRSGIEAVLGWPEDPEQTRKTLQHVGRRLRSLLDDLPEAAGLDDANGEGESDD